MNCKRSPPPRPNHNTNQSAFIRQMFGEDKMGKIVPPKWRQSCGAPKTEAVPGARSRRRRLFPPGRPAAALHPRRPPHPRARQRGASRRRRGKAAGPVPRGPTLTFSKPVLEVGVTSSLAVEVNAIPDKKSPADTGGDGAVPAHHLLSTEEQEREPRRRAPRRSSWPRTLTADRAAATCRSPRGTRKGREHALPAPAVRGPRACPRQCLKSSAGAASAPAQGA